MEEMKRLLFKFDFGEGFMNSNKERKDSYVTIRNGRGW